MQALISAKILQIIPAIVAFQGLLSTARVLHQLNATEDFRDMHVLQ
jgi:hypothetical protein